MPHGKSSRKRSTNFCITVPICRKLVSLSTAGAVSWQRRLLKFLGIASECFAENARHILVVPDDHVSVVFLVIIVLPAFVPPAKADNRGPFFRKNDRQRAARPFCGVAMFVVQIATKLGDDD